MRIGVNTRLLLEGKLEGIGLFTHEVLRRLVEVRPNDDFVFFFDRKPSPNFLYNDRVKPVVVRPQARHPLLWYWWFEQSIPRALNKYKVDLFLSPDGYTTLKTDIPRVTVIHDLAFHHYKDHVPGAVHRYLNKYTPQFARKSDRIITVSEFSKRDITAAYDIPADRICVAGNGCDDAIHPLTSEQQDKVRGKVSQGSPYFLYIGAIHPRKNTGRLLQAFDRFRKRSDREMKLLLVGRWAWQTDEFQDILDNMEFKDDVISFGHMEREQLGRILASAEALVYPSLFEGFGIPVLEAMYADVPVITSKDSSMSEVAGDAAHYVDALDVDDIARAMQKMCDTEGLKAKLIQRGQQQRQKYSWERSAALVNECLEQVISSNK